MLMYLFSGNKKLALYTLMNIYMPMDLISGKKKIALYTPMNIFIAHGFDLR